MYLPGKKNGKANALTRRSGNFLQNGDERILFQSQTILKSQNFQILANIRQRNRVQPIEDFPVVADRLEKNDGDRNPVLKTGDLLDIAYQNEDDIIHKIMKFITNDDCQNKVFRNLRLSIADCEIRNQKLFFKDRLVVLDNDDLRLEIIKQAHNSLSTKNG